MQAEHDRGRLPAGERPQGVSDDTDTIPGPQRMAVYADPKLITVRGSAVVPLTLRPHGFRPVYIGASRGGWTVDRFKRGVDRLPDLLAALQAAGHRVTSVAVDKPPPPEPVARRVVEPVIDGQVALW